LFYFKDSRNFCSLNLIGAEKTKKIEAKSPKGGFFGTGLSVKKSYGFCFSKKRYSFAASIRGALFCVNTNKG